MKMIYSLRLVVAMLVSVLVAGSVPAPIASAAGCTNDSLGYGFGPVDMSCLFTAPCRNGLNVFAKWVNSDPQQNIEVEARAWCDDSSPANELDPGDNQVYCTDTDSNCEAWGTDTTSGTPIGRCWGKAHEDWDSNNALECKDGAGSFTGTEEPSQRGGFHATLTIPPIRLVLDGSALPLATACTAEGLCVPVMPTCGLDRVRADLACMVSSTSPPLSLGAPSVMWDESVL